MNEQIQVILAKAQEIAVQDYRNQGDYGFGPSVTSEQVEEALQWAHKFLKEARIFLSDKKVT